MRDSQKQFEELLGLLLTSERHDIAEIQERLNNKDIRSKEVGVVLARAIQAESTRGDDLAQSLAEPVSQGLKASITKEPAYYADILYPVLAPAIRKSISQAISSLLSTIQQTLESTTTASGLAMRFRSVTSGVPYAELALLQSMLFKVEHVYLIERDSGILLHQLSAPSSASLDSDAVSAMLSAIESFVTDSFDGDDEDRLTDLKVGERNVWVAHVPRLMLACVIYGDPPPSFKTDLTILLDSIRVKYAPALSSSPLDTEEFTDLDEDLLPLLQSQSKADRESRSRFNLPTFLICAGLLIAILWLAGTWIEKRKSSAKLEALLSDVPGLVVTNVIYQNGSYLVSGLKDPVFDVSTLPVDSIGIDSQQLIWKTKPYLSMDLDIEAIRLASVLELEPTMHIIRTQNNSLSLIGSGSLAWFDKYDSTLSRFEAAKRIDGSTLALSIEQTRIDLLNSFSEEQLVGAQISFSPQSARNLVISGELSDQQRLVLKEHYVNSSRIKVLAD